MQQDVARFEQRHHTRLGRDVDDDRAAFFAGEFQIIERLGVFGGLPGEIKIAESFVMSLGLGGDDRANERRGQNLQLIAGLAENQTDDPAPGDGRFGPANAFDFRAQFQLHVHGIAHVGVTDGKPAELSLAHLQIARAPADDLDVFVFLDRLRQGGGFESGPEFFVRAGDDGDVGRIIHPFHFGIPPAAASAFLHAHQRAVGQVIGRSQDLPRADDQPGFGDRLDAFGPGLKVIVLFAIDFDADQGALPVACGLPGGFAAQGGDRSQQQPNHIAMGPSKLHRRRSLGTP